MNYNIEKCERDLEQERDDPVLKNIAEILEQLTVKGPTDIDSDRRGIAIFKEKMNQKSTASSDPVLNFLNSHKRQHPPIKRTLIKPEMTSVGIRDSVDSKDGIKSQNSIKDVLRNVQERQKISASRRKALV